MHGSVFVLIFSNLLPVEMFQVLGLKYGRLLLWLFWVLEKLFPLREEESDRERRVEG